MTPECGDSLDGDEEGDGNGVEEEPAGFGVEAVEGEAEVSVVSDGDEGGDAREVEEPDGDERDGDEAEGSGEAEFFAGKDEPGEGEGEHEGDAFDTGAGTGDDDLKAWGAEDGRGGVADDGGVEELEDGVDAGEVARCMARPKGESEVSHERRMKERADMVAAVVTTA